MESFLHQLSNEKFAPKPLLHKNEHVAGKQRRLHAAVREPTRLKTIRPEHLGWTKLETKEEWISAVVDYFRPQLYAPFVPAICFPLIKGATDYHWAVHNGNYWLEQEGHG